MLIHGWVPTFVGHPVAYYVGWHSRTGLFIEREQTQTNRARWMRACIFPKGVVWVTKLAYFLKKGVFSEKQWSWGDFSKRMSPEKQGC